MPINSMIGKINLNQNPTGQLFNRPARFSVLADSLIFLKSSFKSTNIVAGIVPLQDLEIQSVKMSVTNSSTIIETKVFGMAGSVKEFITPNDVEIAVQGLLMASVQDRLLRQTTPENQARLLSLYANGATPIKVDCKFLNQTYSVDKVVIIDAVVTREFLNYYEVQINMKSDYSLDLNNFKKGL